MKIANNLTEPVSYTHLKTLLNCLSHQGGYGLDKETIKEVLQEAGVDERVRGEALTIEEFAKLSDLFYDRKRP